MRPGEYRVIYCMKPEDGVLVQWQPMAQPGLSMPEVLNRLIAIGRIQSGAHCTLLHGDRIDQDQLYDVQEKLSKLIVDVANVVPGGAEKIQKALPHDFEVTKKKQKARV